jgi:hypothetical protein
MMNRRWCSTALVAALLTLSLTACSEGSADRFGSDYSSVGKYLEGSLCVVTAAGCDELMPDGKALPANYETELPNPGDGETVDLQLAQKKGDATTDLGTLSIPWKGKPGMKLSIEVSATGRISANVKYAGGGEHTVEAEKPAAMRDAK